MVEGVVLLREGGARENALERRRKGRGTGPRSPGMNWTDGQPCVSAAAFSLASVFVYGLLPTPLTVSAFYLSCSARADPRRCRDTVPLHHGTPWQTVANRAASLSVPSARGISLASGSQRGILCGNLAASMGVQMRFLCWTPYACRRCQRFASVWTFDGIAIDLCWEILRTVRCSLSRGDL